MKTRLELAHEWSLKYYDKDYPNMSVELAYDYADAMLAENEKREENQKDEWKPDWSQAPDWANYFAISDDGFGKWMKSKGSPYISDYTNTWFCLGRYYNSESCPSFNYQGDWKDSLRKRPTGERND